MIQDCKLIIANLGGMEPTKSEAERTENGAGLPGSQEARAAIAGETAGSPSRPSHQEHQPRAIRRLSNGDVKRRSSSSRSANDRKLDVKDTDNLSDHPQLPEVESPPSRSHSSGSRSRSRSQDQQTNAGQKREKKDKSKMTEEELRQERELKKMKKKLRKQKKRAYRDVVSDPQVINNIRKAIQEDTHIPDQLKDKFIAIEINPLCLCIANPPYNSVSQGLQHYFNTFLKDLFPEYAQNRKDPVRRIELADTKKYCVLYMQDDDIAEELLDMGPLEYQTSNLKVVCLSCSR